MPLGSLPNDLLVAALTGYEVELCRINDQIANIRHKLGYSVAASISVSDAIIPRRKFSATTRRKMARAQRLRWQKVNESSQMPKARVAAKPKRKLSAAGRKRIGEAARKRWAAFRKQAAAKQAVTLRSKPSKKAKE